MIVAVAGCAQLMADSIETLMKQGIELLTAGKYDAAVTKFLEVVQRDPKSWNGYLYLARAYIGKGAWGDAITSGKKALELAPSATEVAPTLAEAFLGGFDRRLRYIENGDVAEPGGQQVIDKRGLAAAHIDDRCMGANRGSLDQS